MTNQDANEPANTTVDLSTVSDDDITAVIGAIIGAAAPPDGLLPVQSMVIRALTQALTGRDVDPSTYRAWSPDEVAAQLADHDDAFRHRVMRYISLNALLVDPLPDDAVERADRYAEALGLGTICHRMLDMPSAGQADAMMHDFERNGYAQEFIGEGNVSLLHTGDHDLGDGWKVIDDDPKLASLWDSLADCAPDSFGRAVHDFYWSRSFVAPGRPDSAPPLLAQHDFVHVLADYGTRVECELEVFGLIAESDDDPRGFSLLAMVIGLFVTGNLDRAAGIFEADKGHLDEAIAVRLGDAMRRGMQSTKPDGTRTGGLLATDWFAYKDVTVDEMRKLCHMPPKSPEAILAGSPSTWSVAGLSAYQVAHCNLEPIEARGGSTDV